MLVFWRQKLVFLATPKTASTSIETALSPMAAVIVLRPAHLKHTNAQKYHRQVAPFLGDGKGETFVTTALMREPTSWLSSWYRYRQRDGEVPEKTTRDMSFDDFVLGYCRADQPEFARVGAQATFLTPQGHRPVDYIFRYERMDLFVGFLEKRLGTPIKLPVENVSPAGEPTLSPAVEAALRLHCARDFALYAALAG
jgi:hypothetical protein